MMQRRWLLKLGALAPMGLFGSRYLRALVSTGDWFSEQRGQAEQLDTLAANIHTTADARRLVDFVADTFAKETPSSLRSNSILKQISRAEFAAVSIPAQLIPEERLATAWNAYVETLKAPATCKVTAAEIHYLRDAFLTSARMGWPRTIWSVSSIYATGPGGGIASGCRAIEAIRILSDLAERPQNLERARDAVNRGELFSEALRRSQAQQPPHAESRMVVGSFRNPMQIAQWQYIQSNGIKALNKAVIAMLDRTLA